MSYVYIFLSRYTFFFLHVVVIVYSYKIHDAVSLLEQAQVGDLKTKWHHIGKEKTPHFGIDSLVSIVPPYSRQDYETTKTFKMKFAFSNYKFLIPWVLLADGNGNYLKKIVFIIDYDEAKILCINHRIIYFDFDDSKAHAKPEEIHLQYVWNKKHQQLGFRDKKIGTHTVTTILCFASITLISILIMLQKG
jgi:hypothetical protein